MCKACRYEFDENGEPIISAAQHEVWLREHGDFDEKEPDRWAAHLEFVDFMDGSNSEERALRQKLQARGIPRDGWLSPSQFSKWTESYLRYFPGMEPLDAYEVYEHGMRTTWQEEEARRLAKEEQEKEREEDDGDRRRWASTSNPFDDSPGSSASQDPFEESWPWQEDEEGER